LVDLPRGVLPDSPRLRPYRRVFAPDFVCERLRLGTGPALGHVQGLPRALKIGFRTKVRDVDHERIALPTAARVAVPLADVGRQMRTSVHDDVALPSLALTHVVEDRYAARCLHDPAEAPGRASKLG